MLTVKTHIAPSRIHGIGLYADEPIPAGTVIWEFTPLFDVVFTEADIERLPPPARPHVDKYAYYDTDRAAFVLCGDDARFMNHADAPNTFEESGKRTVARRDISAGEEITCDYAELGIDPATLR